MSIRRTRKRIAYLLALTCAVLLVFLPASRVLTDTPMVGVMYPEIREPYRGVFLKIVQGIEAELGTEVKRYVLPEDYSPETLNGWLSRERITTVIALGSRGLRAATQMPEAVQVVVGAVLNAPSEVRFPVVTLNPDPAAFFDRLHQLAPGVRRVTVVYNPQRSGWLMERARAAAKGRGLTLSLLPARGRREAALRYRDVMDGVGEEPMEAVWLLQDPSTLDTRTVLPLVLREAWKRNLVVFCSNPAHVKRGVLFALYPDNVGMGRTLGRMVSQGKEADNLKISGGLPLRDLLIAVNVRTADHLGLEITSRQKRAFDLVFPSP